MKLPLTIDTDNICTEENKISKKKSLNYMKLFEIITI